MEAGITINLYASRHKADLLLASNVHSAVAIYMADILF